MRKFLKAQSQGFTLIEILVVIGIIAVLATIVLIAINPARQFAQSRNAQRSSNVNAILNAIGQYVADHKGTFPDGTPSGGSAAVPIPSAMCSDLISRYIPSLPSDPKSNFEGDAVTNCSDITGAKTVSYTVFRDTADRITISAPLTELTSESDAPEYTCGTSGGSVKVKTICVTR